MIRKLREFQIGQVIRQEGPAVAPREGGTPTMGGLLILTAALVPTLLWADLTNVYVWIAVLDDGGVRRDRIRRRLPEDRRAAPTTACSPRYKMGCQILIGARASASSLLVLAQRRPLQHAADLSVLQAADSGSRLVATCRSPCSCWSRESNAVNLTDGLDGLAISTFAIAAAAYTALAYVTGHRVLADYLLLVRFPPAAELTVFCGALVGARLGFLWYNSYPAEIFMGDVGSLALGGALGTVAILIKQELLLRHRRRRVRARGAVGDHPGRVVQADRASACSGWRRCTTTSS